MVDFESVYFGAKKINNVCYYSDAADSGIVCDSDEESLADSEEDYFGKFQGALREIMVRQNEVRWSRKYSDLPCDRIVPPSHQIYAATTGPGEGVQSIVVEPVSPSKTFKGCKPFGSWSKKHHRAHGIGTSLYDCDPVTNITNGDPVADVYAVVAAENSCILALADGVNWGEKSRLAARCAIAGCLQYLSSHLYTANTTHDIMSSLLKAFKHAQDCILQKNATMTTLCVAVVCQLEASDRWGVCVVNVGDSLAFTYKKSKGVQEVTIGSHYDNEERDMRCPGGSLGPVDGYNPDLSNLTFSYTVVDCGDIVFLTSDGVSDNFDPIVTQCKHCEIPGLKHSSSLDSVLDVMSKSKIASKEFSDCASIGHSSKSDDDIHQYQMYDVPIARHRKMLDTMTEVIQQEGLEEQVSAVEVCAKLLSHVCKCTAKKRTFLEGVDRDDHKLTALTQRLQKARDREISRLLSQLPGKLDHAAVVAFEVGHFSADPLKLVPGGENNGMRRPSKIGHIISGVKNAFSRRTSQIGSDDDEGYEMDSCGSYTELYALCGYK